MWAKLLAQILMALVGPFAQFLIKTGQEWSEKRRLKKENEIKARKVENAETHDDIRAAADDLP